MPTGLNDLWATRNVKVRNSELLYETSFDGIDETRHFQKRDKMGPPFGHGLLFLGWIDWKIEFGGRKESAFRGPCGSDELHRVDLKATPSPWLQKLFMAMYSAKRATWLGQALSNSISKCFNPVWNRIIRSLLQRSGTYTQRKNQFNFLSFCGKQQIYEKIKTILASCKPSWWVTYIYICIYIYVYVYLYIYICIYMIVPF